MIILLTDTTFCDTMETGKACGNCGEELEFRSDDLTERCTRCGYIGKYLSYDIAPIG